MSVSRKIFLTFLTDTPSGKSYFVQNGHVQSTNIPTPLEQTPGGWLDSEITFGRSSKYFGLNRTFTQPLKFVDEGAQIIRKFLYQGKGIESPLTLIILKWSEDTDTYELYYKGELDLLKVQDSATEGVTANLMEGGLTKLFKANETTVYEIPCDGSIPENIRVNIDGLKFRDTFHYSILASELIVFGCTVPLIWVSNEGDNIGIIHGDPTLEPTGATGYYATSSNYFFSTVSPTSIRIKGTIAFQMVNHAHIPLTYEVLVNTSTGQSINLLPLATYPENTYFSFDQVINLVAGESAFFVFNFTQTPLPGTFLNVLASDFTVEFDSRYKTTQTWAIRPADLFRLLVQKATGGLYPVSNQLLEDYEFIAATSGMALRQTPNAVIKTSLSDFFESFGTILCGALGIDKTSTGLEEELFFERRKSVFDPSSTTVSLGEVSGLKITLAEEYFSNTIKVGYPEQQYDEKQGQQEFNTTFQFSEPIIRVKKEAILISKYRADSYGIEYTRYFTPGNNTVNNKSDNDTFLLRIDAGSGAPDQYHATKTDPELYGVMPANVKFDSFAGNNFTPNGDNSQFTYAGPSRLIGVGAAIAPEKSDGTNLSVTIFRNTDIVATSIVPGTGGTTGIGGNIVINPGDVIRVAVGYVGVGVIGVTVNSATLTINLTTVSVYNLYRKVYTSISGIVNPDTAYNIEDLTPGRILRVNADFLKSTLFNQAPASIQFLTAGKNPLLSTDDGTAVVTENANIPVSSLGSPMFYPFIFEFSTDVPVNFINLFTGVANSHIQFTYNGRTFYGFPIEMKAKPALNESQTWKLLCSPSTNLSDLLSLDIDGLNYLDLMGLESFIPYLCPVQFVPLNGTAPSQYHFKNMDSDWHSEQVKFWADKKPYFQKWQQNDVIKLQMQTNGLGPVQVQLIDATGNNIGGPIGLTHVISPYILAPRQLYQGNVPLTGLNGIYYLLLTAGTGGTTTQFISEGLWIKPDWPMTLLFEYSHRSNKQAILFKPLADGSVDYTPSIRLDGWMDEFSPEAKYSVHEDQPADLEMLNGIPFRKFKLNIGINGGTPDWTIDKANRILLLSNVKIDGVGYTREADAKFEVQNAFGNPKRYWSIDVREAKNREGITVDTNGVLDDNVTVVYNINTKGFGDGAGANNIIQVIELQ